MALRLTDLPPVVPMAGLVALSMLVPASHAVVLRDFHVARAFFYSGLALLVLTGFVALALANRRPRDPARMNLRALIWAYLLLPVMMAVPMVEALPGVSPVDMWFEMISCFTTTGLTHFHDAKDLPASVHLWRAQVGWIGGFTILVAAAAILAPVNLGGMEVVSGRVPGRVESGAYWLTGKVDPALRLQREVMRMFPPYAGVTLALWLGLILAGDDSLPGLVHSMSAVSTSGISPGGDLADSTSGRLGEVLVLLVLFTALSRRFWPGAGLRVESGPFWRDPELRLAGVVTVVVTAVLMFRHVAIAAEDDGVAEAMGALWGTVFTTISFLTTTGFVSADWETSRLWSGLQTPGLLLAGLAIMGGGVATAAGGVKLLRVYALFRHGEREMERLIHPNSVGGAGHSARRLRSEGAYAAWVFFLLFALTLGVGTAAFTLLGQEFEEALVLTIAALTTTGQLIHAVPESPISLDELGAAVKAVAGLVMIVGRLETLALLVFVLPGAWKG